MVELKACHLEWNLVLLKAIDGISLGTDDGSELGWSEGMSIDRTLELVNSSEG